MRERIDYTTRAIQFVGRFPVLSFVLTQINFWVIANIFLAIFMHLQAQAINQVVPLPMQTRLVPSLIVAVILGVLYGIALGVADYFFDKQIFKGKPLGKIIVLKTIISVAVLTLLFAFLQFVLFDLLIAPGLGKNRILVNQNSWKYVFCMFLIYYFLINLIITFINQVNKKYGPGVLIPLLMGKYRKPIEEERIFMFMDLKASTSIAESLGHIQYSSFIRDAFLDINHVLFPHSAQVYQYVGDEIVVSWVVKEGLRNLNCVNFYFACEKQFADKEDYYMKNYGQLPHFKAGLHMGKVTAVEIGEIKRDIAYHGDTLNTTARIQSLCNHYGKKFLVSDFFLSNIVMTNEYIIESIGKVLLKGKTEPVGLSSIELNAVAV